jgi:hypothetical protein
LKSVCDPFVYEGKPVDADGSRREIGIRLLVHRIAWVDQSVGARPGFAVWQLLQMAADLE